MRYGKQERAFCLPVTNPLTAKLPVKLPDAVKKRASPVDSGVRLGEMSTD